jgi:hypothetical protein
MAADVQTGMDKQDMKRLLMKSKKEPVNCAIGQGADPSVALLLLDKVKAPKAVEKELAKQIPEAKNTRFGTAVVDVDEDPKLVLFYVNKPTAGIAKKLVKTLKGTGFSKVKILLEDGSAVEDGAADEGDAPPQPGQPQADPAQASAPAAAAEPHPAAPPAAPPAAADPGALPRMLTDLVKRLAQADASRQTGLKGLALEAQARLKAGDPAGASAAIEQLRAALDEIGPASPATGGAPAPAAAAAYAKARVAWLATRQKLETDIGKLQTVFASAFKDHAMSADLSAAFQSRVEKVLVQLDSELAHKLDAVAKAADPAQHAKLVGEARQIMQRYETYVAGDPTLAELDANPFVPLSIQKTLITTLSVLSKAIG